MKKLLMIAATTAILSSTALAEGIENTFYGKVNVGAQMLTAIKDKISDLKLKPRANAFAGLGVGYYLMDNVRADLVYDHYFNPEQKKTGESKKLGGIKGTAKHKANIDSLLLNGYVDLDVSMVKLFLGAGVGVAQVKEKATFTNSTLPNGNKVPDPSGSSKRRTNVAFAVHAGASMDVSEGLVAEVAYSYRDFGKTKSTKSLDQSTSYKGHHVAAGLRVSF